MSPAYGRDSLQVGASTACPRDARPWLDGFGDLSRDLDGRPHGGKEGVERLDPAAVRRMYPMAERFAALAADLDPKGVFRNAFVDRILP